MTTRFESNLAYLEQHYPLTLAEITRESSCEVALLETEKGLTLKVGQTLLHEPDQIEHEATRLALPAQNDLHLVFGLGLGYVLNRPPQRGMVIVWEPEPNVAKVWVETAEIDKQLIQGHVRITCEYERFQYLAHYFVAQYGKYNLVIHNGHSEAFPAAYALFQQCLRALRQDLGLKWSNRIGPLILQSSHASLPYYAASLGVEVWRNGFADKPAVIVAAGPSLEKNLQHLAAKQDQVLIFALARTAKPLIEKGIRPHFLVHVEAQDYIHLLYGLQDQLRDTYFLLADQTHPTFYEYAPQRTLVFRGKNNPITKCFEKAFPQRHHEVIKTGGSVATAAFYLAYFFGCDPLILIGQDLAVEKDRWYAFSDFKHDAKAHVRVKGYYGGQVTTLGSYAQNIFWYRKAVAAMKQRRPESRIINATEGGAYLDGMEHISFEEALAVCTADQANCDLPALPEITMPDIEPLRDQINRLLPALKHWQAEVGKAVDQCEALLSGGQGLSDPSPLASNFKQIMQEYTLAQPLLQAEVAAIDGLVEATSGRVVAWSILGAIRNNVQRLLLTLNSEE